MGTSLKSKRRMANSVAPDNNVPSRLDLHYLQSYLSVLVCLDEKVNLVSQYTTLTLSPHAVQPYLSPLGGKIWGYVT